MNTKILGIACLTLLANTLHAENIQEMGEVKVTARPYGSQSIHVPQPITVLSGEELKRRQDSTIGETLTNIPGVTTNRYSPLASRPIIRGLGGARVQILENKLSSMDVSTISVDHPVAIDPTNAEQIEVLRGPASLLYGSDATSGLVNVVTNRIPQVIPTTFDGKVYTSYNSNSQETVGAIQLDGGLKNMAFHFDGSHRDANDYEAESGTVINSFYDVTNINAGTSYIDDWGFIGISVGRFDSVNGIPLNPDEPDELKFLDTEAERLSLSSRVNSPFSGIQAALLDVAYNDYSHVEFEGPGEQGTVFDNEQLDGRIELKHDQIGNFNGSIGAQFGYRNVAAIGDEAFIPKTDRKSVAVFIFEETNITDDLYLELGARFEHQSHDAEGFGDITHNMYSLSTGVHWHFIESTSLNVAIGRSQRGPQAEELFSNGAHEATATFEVGDSTLDEETVNSLDISLRDEQGRWQWTANLFVNYFQDFIFLQGVDSNNDGEVDEVDDDGNLGGELLSVAYLQDDAVFYGFEFETGYNLYSGAEGILDARLFADYVRGQLTNGDNLERISPPRIGAGLDYMRDKLIAGIELTQTLAQNDNGALETDTDGFTLLNLRADYEVYSQDNSSVNIFARANNLLDEDGRLHTSFIKDRAPIQGQAFIIGLNAGF